MGISYPATHFSAELLLAVSRLGHLERYRDKIKMMYQPGDCKWQAISWLANAQCSLLTF